ncbi:hypothetical protein MTO96_019312 [Rhipicephalus appendiculatus]
MTSRPASSSDSKGSSFHVASELELLSDTEYVRTAKVDSVSVHYRNHATADAGTFRRLFGGYKPLERTRPPGYVRFKNAGSSMGRCQNPGFARAHQSLRLLVTVAFLLVAFVLASALLATKHVDNVPRRNKDMGVKHGLFGESVQVNSTGVDSSGAVKTGSSLEAKDATTRVVLNEDTRLSFVKDIFAKQNSWNWTGNDAI